MTLDEAVELAARAIRDESYKHHIVGDGREHAPDAWEKLEPRARKLWLDQACAALRAVNAAGLAPVPKEPTDDIMRSACDDWRLLWESEKDNMRRIVAAAIEAGRL